MHGTMNLRAPAPVSSSRRCSASSLQQLRVRPSVAHRDVAVAGKRKGKSRMRQGGFRQQQRPKIPTPPVDPDNEEFVVFVRAVQMPRWIPFTVVKGGTQANVLVKAMKGNFGTKFYNKTLVNNIAQVCFHWHPPPRCLAPIALGL